jgi:hypothetical protein
VARYRSFPSCHKKLLFFRGNKDIGRHVLAGDIVTPISTRLVLAAVQEFFETTATSFG